MFSTPVSLDEFQKNLVDFNRGNSLSLDGLSTNLLKHLASVIHTPLVYIFNLCLSSGVFPTKWNIARVIPRYKKGDKTNVDNYRPIAILSPLSKILEKLFHKRILSYLDKKIF